MYRNYSLFNALKIVRETHKIDKLEHQVYFASLLKIIDQKKKSQKNYKFISEVEEAWNIIENYDNRYRKNDCSEKFHKRIKNTKKWIREVSLITCFSKKNNSILM